MTRRAALKEALVVAVGSLLGAVAFTWPLAFHLESRTADVIDSRFQSWTIDWVQWGLEHGRNVYDASIFLPDKTTLAYSDTLLGVAVPTLPLRWIGLSAVGVYSAALILAFATAAAGAYVLARYVTGSRLAGAVAGAAFAFGPFSSNSEYHMHMAMCAGMPLAAACAWWLADRAEAKRPLRAPAIGLASAVVWSMTVSFYPGTYALITAGVILLVRVRSLGRRGLWVAGASLAAIVVCSVLLAIPNLVVADRYESGPHAYRYSLESFGPQGADFFHTIRSVRLWGPVLGSPTGAANTKPNATFPGITIVLLGLIGTISGWRARGKQRTVVVAAAALTAFGAVLAIGTAASGVRQYAPYRLLYELGPPFNVLRSTGRAWVIGLCGMALLAGMGALTVAAWVRARVQWSAATIPVVVGAVAVLLLMAEGWNPYFEKEPVRIGRVNEVVAERPESGGVLYLPVNIRSDDIDLTYFQQPNNLLDGTLHHRQMPNGLAGYVPPTYFENSVAFQALPRAPALRRLRRIGVRFVIVHRTDVEGTPWAKLRDPAAAKPLRYLGTYDGDVLYEVPAS